MTDPVDGIVDPSSFQPPFDQRPADQQPSPVPRPFGAPRPIQQSPPPPPPPPPSAAAAPAPAPGASGPPPPPPHLAQPSSDSPVDATEAAETPGTVAEIDVVIRPLDMTIPTDLFAGRVNGPDQSGGPARPVAPPISDDGFVPLRSEPPPRLVATWWLRVVMFVAMCGALASVLLTEYFGEAGDVRSSSVIVGFHLASAGALVAWSFLAIHNAERLVPASRYSKSSSGSIAVALWLLAFAAPGCVLIMYRELSGRLDDSDDVQAVFIMAAIVLAAFILVWLPFRYHARHAARVGAPHRTMYRWFFAPIFATVGGLAILAMGLRTMLAEEGMTQTERVIQVGVAYGLPMLVFVLSTIRAVTVIDEVVDLRWRRWKTEWEHTLQEFVAQPLPGPEGSPNIDDI
jgi:hypothetical protein